MLTVYGGEVIEIGINIGPVTFRVRVERDSLGEWIVITRHGKRALSDFFDSQDGERHLGAENIKDIIHVLDVVCAVGLPAKSLLTVDDVKIRAVGLSTTLGKLFIIDFCLNQNTIDANSYVINAKNGNNEIIPQGIDVFANLAVKVKVGSILRYFVRILSRR